MHQLYYNKRMSLPRCERGAATLVTAIILLVAITLMTFASARVSVMEQKMSANDYRAKQAFEAAQAGIEHAIAVLNDPTTKATFIADNVNNSTNAEGSDGFIDTTVALPARLEGAGNVSRYNVTFANTVMGKFTAIQITSTGTVGDPNPPAIIDAQATVTQLIRASGPGGLPPEPIVNLGDTVLGGSANIINNTATGPAAGRAIRSGGEVKVCGGSRVTTGDGTSGISKNDSELAAMTGDQFFSKTFSASKEAIKSQALQYTPETCRCRGNYNTLLNGVQGQIIWITGEMQLNSGTVVGSPSAPVIIIVEGAQPQINGGATIYGMIYTIGNWNNNGAGNMTLHGSAVTEGNFSTNGNPTFQYNESVAENIKSTRYPYSKVNGGWSQL